MTDLFGVKGAAEAAGKAVTKLIEVLQIGVGGIFAPWQMRRLARAKADAHQIRARGRLETERLLLQGQEELEELRRKLEPRQLPATTGDEPLVIDVTWEEVPDDSPTHVVEPLRERTKHRLEYQEAKRQLNVEAVAQHAFDELPHDEAVSDAPVDPDWIARFFENVKDISDADMKRLWGRLLAGEVTQPGNFSLRTLDALRNMTSTEARLFQLACHVCSNAGEILLIDSSDAWAASKLSPLDFRRLVECGLLHPANEVLFGGLGKTPINMRFRSKLLRVSDPVNHPHGLPSKIWGGVLHNLTAAGVQLANLGPRGENVAFLEALCADARKHDLVASVTDVGSPVSKVPEAQPSTPATSPDKDGAR